MLARALSVGLFNAERTNRKDDHVKASDRMRPYRTGAAIRPNKPG
jgi:hypothetical protein